jgi:hypothetical protein
MNQNLVPRLKLPFIPQTWQGGDCRHRDGRESLVVGEDSHPLCRLNAHIEETSAVQYA